MDCVIDDYVTLSQVIKKVGKSVKLPRGEIVLEQLGGDFTQSDCDKLNEMAWLVIEIDKASYLALRTAIASVFSFNGCSPYQGKFKTGQVTYGDIVDNLEIIFARLVVQFDIDDTLEPRDQSLIRDALIEQLDRTVSV